MGLLDLLIVFCERKESKPIRSYSLCSERCELHHKGSFPLAPSSPLINKFTIYWIHKLETCPFYWIDRLMFVVSINVSTGWWHLYSERFYWYGWNLNFEICYWYGLSFLLKPWMMTTWRRLSLNSTIFSIGSTIFSIGLHWYGEKNLKLTKLMFVIDGWH